MKKIIVAFFVTILTIFPIYADEKLNQNLYEAGENISVDGEYDGISFVAGMDLNVNTTSLFGALAGQNINFKGITEKDLFVAGEKIEISGIVKRDVYAAGSEVKITGVVEGNLYVISEKVVISETAQIKGNIKFYGTELENKGVLEGKVSYYEDANVSGLGNIETNIMKNNNKVDVKDKIINIGYSLLRYLFVFMIITFAFPKLLKYIKTKYNFNNITDYMVTTGVGIIGMFVVPFIAVLLLISNIGISLGLIMITLYIIAIYITTIISGYIIGNLITSKIIKMESNDYISGLLGITSIVILSYVPYIGSLISMISLLFGFGLIIKMLVNRENRTL